MVLLKKEQTSRFIDPWPYLSLGIALLVLIAALIAPTSKHLILSDTTSVAAAQKATLPPITLEPQRIGALRIDVRADLPRNQWATYEVQLLDPSGQILAAGIKQAFDRDLQAGLDVKLQQQETLTIAIEVIKYSDVTGVDINGSVPFRTRVEQGVIDTRYLWIGVVGAGICAALGFLSLGVSGVKVIDKSIADSDLNARQILGGPGRLTCVQISVLSDETSPRELQAKLWVNDGQGNQLCSRVLPIPLKFHYDDGDLDHATGKAELFLTMAERSSYGFTVEIIPDGPVDRTRLIVRDRVRTAKGIEVYTIGPL